MSDVSKFDIKVVIIIIVLKKLIFLAWPVVDRSNESSIIDMACFSSQLKYFEHYYVCICLVIAQWLKVKVNYMGDFFV